MEINKIYNEDCLDTMARMDDFCLIEPNDYRQDWAREWRNWFNNGCVGYPNLIL